ncbi:CRTAC1 family protein [Novipirellula maiorica]|uniref:CRTAC1 family protein n=1 Tax=Novipirellula maiorica TaxID=1265734 RepID=UPI000349A6A5|nr:CRTAC1 family protein [Rhodopirellula maiorica]
MIRPVLLLLIAALIPALGCKNERPSKPLDRPKASGTVAADTPSAESKLFGEDLRSADADSGLQPSDGFPTATATDRIHFTNVAKRLGLNFVYQNGETGESLMVEAVGGGVGVLDFDRDGHPDLFFSQGGDPAADTSPHQPAVSLFRNTLHRSAPQINAFADVAHAAQLGRYGYGQGVTIGDFNADGFEDVYLTCVGKNTLLANQGDGTFRDVTPTSNTGDGDRWSTSAAFADLNRDGLLDLYVCNYVTYDPKHPLNCRNSKGENRICHPREIPPWPNACYINQTDGTFAEQTDTRGLVAAGGKSLGVAVADFNADGDPDIYVANDTTANFLFDNQGNGQFDERGLLLGCASNYEGLLQASMGLAVADFDRNGFLDIYATHYYEESNTLYRNLGNAGFQDITGRTGLHTPTLQSLAFGTVMQDFDCDGWQDLFVTNGHVENYADNPILKMRPQFFQYNGSRWIETSERVGKFFAGKYVGRGVATLDFDNDGDLDIAVVHQNTPSALLRNDSPRGHWLKLNLIGRQSPRQGTGCRVTVTAGDVQHVQELVGGGSYLSTSEPVLVFGLGEFDRECQIEVRWPSGLVQQLDNLRVDQVITIEEADGMNLRE